MEELAEHEPFPNDTGVINRIKPADLLEKLEIAKRLQDECNSLKALHERDLIMKVHALEEKVSSLDVHMRKCCEHFEEDVKILKQKLEEKDELITKLLNEKDRRKCVHDEKMAAEVDQLSENKQNKFEEEPRIRPTVVGTSDADHQNQVQGTNDLPPVASAIPATDDSNKAQHKFPRVGSGYQTVDQTKQDLDKNILSHTQKQKATPHRQQQIVFKCSAKKNKCDCVFGTQKEFYEHLVNQHKYVLCSICNKPFISQQMLWIHRRKTHQKVDLQSAYNDGKNADSTKCEFCDKVLENQYHAKKRHYRLAHKAQTYSCPLCANRFSSLNSYTQHKYSCRYKSLNKTRSHEYWRLVTKLKPEEPVKDREDVEKLQCVAKMPVNARRAASEKLKIEEKKRKRSMDDADNAGMKSKRNRGTSKEKEMVVNETNNDTVTVTPKSTTLRSKRKRRTLKEKEMVVNETNNDTVKPSRTTTLKSKRKQAKKDLTEGKANDNRNDDMERSSRTMRRTRPEKPEPPMCPASKITEEQRTRIKKMTSEAMIAYEEFPVKGLIARNTVLKQLQEKTIVTSEIFDSELFEYMKKSKYCIEVCMDIIIFSAWTCTGHCLHPFNIARIACIEDDMMRAKESKCPPYDNESGTVVELSK